MFYLKEEDARVEIEEEPKEADIEFKMALVGPLTSFAIALILWFLQYQARAFEVAVVAPLEYGAYINVLLGGFNLLPDFPLYGGRILRAGIWRWKKDLIRATRIATRVGIFFSYVLIFWGFIFIIGGVFIGGLWFILIGWFLKNGAESSYRQTVISEALAGVLIRDIMTREVHTVDPDVSIKEVAETHFMKHKHGGFSVKKDFNLLGIITLQNMKKVPQEKWLETKVRDAKKVEAFGSEAYLESAKAMREVGARVVLSVGAAILIWLFGQLVFIPISKGMTEVFLGYPVHAIVSFIFVATLAIIIFTVFIDIRRLTGGIAGVLAYQFGKAGGEVSVESFRHYRTALDGILYVIIVSLTYLLFAQYLAEIHPAIPAVVLILIVIWSIFALWRSCRAIAAEIGRYTTKWADELERQAKKA